MAVVLNGRQPERLEHTRQTLAAEGLAVASCVVSTWPTRYASNMAYTGIHFGAVHISFTQHNADKRVLDAAGQPVRIAHRLPHWQKTQAQVADIILQHIRRRQRTVISALVALSC